jgi:hypothetical protein
VPVHGPLADAGLLGDRAQSDVAGGGQGSARDLEDASPIVFGVGAWCPFRLCLLWLTSGWLVANLWLAFG